jgi:hypothetical protein
MEVSTYHLMIVINKILNRISMISKSSAKAGLREISRV